MLQVGLVYGVFKMRSARGKGPRIYPVIPARDCIYNFVIYLYVEQPFYSCFFVNFTFTWPCIVTNFRIIQPPRWTNFSSLFWKWNSTCFGKFLCPSSGDIHCTLSNGILLEICLQICMTYTIAECTVNNSWWWTEELSETCRVSFTK
jgi:hypothetical protein